nr:uncharacterized protein LOC129474213 [Symphalangus syndactylus]
MMLLDWIPYLQTFPCNTPCAFWRLTMQSLRMELTSGPSSKSLPAHISSAAALQTCIGPFKHFSFTVSTMLSFVSRCHWSSTAEEGKFLFLILVCYFSSSCSSCIIHQWYYV